MGLGVFGGCLSGVFGGCLSGGVRGMRSCLGGGIFLDLF